MLVAFSHVCFVLFRSSLLVFSFGCFVPVKRLAGYIGRLRNGQQCVDSRGHYTLLTPVNLAQLYTWRLFTAGQS